ncbi:putative haloacid dehalogenase like hydrolase [Trypanosoma vivax]|uniref:Putative haloacid dehalogenase hydrolase n=1 Tax=Trypanosoma vivax (strain Y486) TaxID=1055687 RepID=G0UBV9_TRYVY|nr:putative haloacid dehalogenase like hydrolase [Trypanosoma vivax]KAH8609589.1 putative haloacid dehalogenase like hydrolase [Trypanosoma vivax]CCC53307.1 putative haloacid dehalogenase hydrolase [Trypanosoma vivax Y486]
MVVPCDGARVAAAAARPFAAVAVDLDGTLLDDGRRISELTMRTLRELVLRGVHIVVATGRHLHAVTAVARSLAAYCCGVDGVPRDGAAGFYLIVLNGARVYSPRGELVVSHNVERDIVHALYRMFVPLQRAASRDDGLMMSVYQTDVSWVSTAVPLEWAEVFEKPPLVCEDIPTGMPVEDVAKVSFRCNNLALLQQHERDVREKFGGRVVTTMSSRRCLDVMAPGVSKGVSLTRVGAVAQFDPATDAIAFGNAMNDEEMLASVAKGCIMENGHERLKEALPHLEVVGSNNDDGVARKLREVFNLD